MLIQVVLIRSMKVLSLTFDGSGSTDNSGVVRYDWDFGDGVTAPNSGPNPSHTYASDGIYVVTLTVYDSAGNSNNANTTVTVNNTPPDITLQYPLGGEVLNGSVDILWVASDPFDPVTIDIYYTIDDGPAISIAAGETNDGIFTWDTTSASGDSDRYRIVVVANDGTDTSSNSSPDFFTVDNYLLTITPLTPEPSIFNPNYTEMTFIPYVLSEPATITVSTYDLATATWINDITVG